MEKLLLLFALLFAFVASSAQRPVPTISVANRTVTFKQSLSAGSIILQLDSNYLWVLKAQASSTTTINTANKFLLNQGIDDTSLTWLDPVISIRAVTTCASIDLSERYIASITGGGWTINNIYECNGSSWVETVPSAGAAVPIIDSGRVGVYNGSTWGTSVATTPYWVATGTNIVNTNTGSVGIKTTTPTAGSALDVNGVGVIRKSVMIGSSLTNSTIIQPSSYAKTGSGTTNFYFGGAATDVGGVAIQTNPGTGLVERFRILPTGETYIGNYASDSLRIRTVTGTTAIEKNSLFNNTWSYVLLEDGNTTVGTKNAWFSINESGTPKIQLVGDALATQQFGVDSNLTVGDGDDYFILNGDSIDGFSILDTTNVLATQYYVDSSLIAIEDSGYVHTTGNDTVYGITMGVNNRIGWLGRNISIGKLSGNGLTTGVQNTYIGQNAGRLNSTASYCTLMGWGAGENNTTAGLTAFGNGAGYNNTTGQWNTFVGMMAGSANTDGQGNTYIGDYAGHASTSSIFSTLIGYRVGYALTTGRWNTIVGATAGYALTTGDANVLMGEDAGQYNIDGQYNTAIGTWTLGYCVHGSNNATLGTQCGTYQQGNDNTLIGCQAGFGHLSIPYERNGLTAVGYQSAYRDTTGTGNTAIGYQSLYTSTLGVENTVVGYKSGYTYNGDGATFIGFEAGYNTTGNGNNFVGYHAGYSNTTGTENLAFGYLALANLVGNNNENIAIGSNAMLLSTAGSNNVVIGSRAGRSLGGSSNIAIGWRSMYDGGGTGNVAIGESTLENATTCSYNTIAGYVAGLATTTGSSNTFYGYAAGYSVTTGEKNTFLGAGAGQVNTASNNVYIGYRCGYSSTTPTNNVFIGHETGYTNVSGDSNTYIGRNAAYTSTASSGTIIGFQAGYYNTTGIMNTHIGSLAGHSNTTGYYNTTVGALALYNLAGGSNTSVGYRSGGGFTSGDYNTFLGYRAGHGDLGEEESASKSYSVAIGYDALYRDTSDGNVGIGYQTLYGTSAGTNNVAVGYQAGYSNQAGSTNVFLGYKAGYSETGSNKLYIDNSNTARPLLKGDFAGDSVTFYGTVINPTGYIADNDATPSVLGRNVWTYNGTANSVTVTDLDNPVAGADYMIIGGSDTYTITINDGGNFKLNTNQNFTMGLDDVIVLRCIADNNYIEISRSPN